MNSAGGAAAAGEMRDQRPDVGAALAQRRHVDVDDAQPIQQIFAELAGRDALGQVAVGRGDHADVDPSRALVRADALELALLEEAQQQRLHPQAHLPDFVEEQRAAVAPAAACRSCRDRRR